MHHAMDDKCAPARVRRAEYRKRYHAAHREEQNAKHRAWYKRNRQEQNAKGRAYYARNCEEKKAKARAYRAEHREERNAWKRAWRAANREKVNAKLRAYRAANRDKVNAKRREGRETRRCRMVMDKDGRWRYEHRVLMERHLGRRLSEREVVHHRNGNERDNRLENLRLMRTHSEHITLHFAQIRLCRILTAIGGAISCTTQTM